MKEGGVRFLRTRFSSAHTSVCFLLVVVLSCQSSLAQEGLPVLRANSRSVDIQDGDRFLKGHWTIDPSVALDIYDAVRPAEDKTVTFTTDAESLSFDVQPGRTYDFIILLNGRDECRTRISTMTQGYRRAGTSVAVGPDTIPITITHGKLHLRGTINGSSTLDLIFDTGANTNVLYPSGIGKGAHIQVDGTTNNVGTGGATLRKTSRDNRLEVAGLQWENEPFLYVEKQADRADGIVGYPVFQDKVVQIDYDRMVMSVYGMLPTQATDYAKTEMRYVGGLTAVEAILAQGEKESSGLFTLDTGGSGTLNVNRAFAEAHGLRAGMRHLGTSASRGVGSGVVRNEVLMLPELKLAGFILRDLPIHVELPSGGNAAPPGGTLNMEVLERFNTFLDYPRNDAYFKPNTHFGAPFKAEFSGLPWLVIVGIVGIVVASLAGLGLGIAKRRRHSIGVGEV
jgi:hypothetical protein